MCVLDPFCTTLKMLPSLVFAVVTMAAANTDTEWATFKTMHKKMYRSLEMEEIRKTIWLENKKYIERHNNLYMQGLSSFYMGQNEYTDLTSDEVFAMMTGSTRIVNIVSEKQGPYNRSLPDSVDWRTKGFVTPVKNQGYCGSCWAFSATGSMEGQHYKKTGRLVSLSESNLVDCSGKFGNFGCKGGWPDRAFEYVIENKGIDTEISYPYIAKGEVCHFKRLGTGAVFANYSNILPRGSEEALQKATAEVGPISICIDAKHRSFQQYRGGIYDEPQCSPTQVDHCVLVVGYGTDYYGSPYWLVKNSWGKSWGMDGYIMMSRNKQNQCGVASYASYPVV